MLYQDWFEECASFIVGNGLRVKFWEDRWYASVLFKENFPLLYVVSRSKNQMVAKVITNNQYKGDWNIDPRRRLTNEEVEEANRMLELLSKI